METEKKSILIEEPMRRIDGPMLLKMIRKYACAILLTALLGGVLGGLARYISTAPTYTVRVKFLVNTVRLVQDPIHEEWRVATDPGDVSGATDIAIGACALFTEDYALEQILSHSELQSASESALLKADLADMMTVFSEGQIMTVSLSDRDRDRVLHVAKAVEQLLPAVMEYYYGVDTAVHAEQVGAMAVALTDFTDHSAEGTSDYAVDYTGRHVALFICLGTLAAASMAFLIALIRTYYDRRIYSAEDLKRCFTSPVLGQIPERQNAPRPKGKPAAGPSSAHGSVEADGSGLLADAPSPAQITAYEHLRIRLLRAAGEKCLVYGVTSADRGGETAVPATNVALSCARLGKRVLLIHGNLRHHRSYPVFAGETQRGGLGELLAGQCTKEAACLRAEISPYLDVIPVGRVPQNPAELLASDAMGELLTAARSRYDLVVMDFPSMGEVSDALIPQKYMTGYILTVHAGKTNLDELKEICATLEHFDAPVTGFVLTDSKTKSRSRFV